MGTIYTKENGIDPGVAEVMGKGNIATYKHINNKYKHLRTTKSYIFSSRFLEGSGFWTPDFCTFFSNKLHTILNVMNLENFRITFVLTILSFKSNLEFRYLTITKLSLLIKPIEQLKFLHIQ